MIQCLFPNLDETIMKICFKPPAYTSQRSFTKNQIHKLPAISSYIDFHEVSKTILAQFNKGSSKIILPIDRVEYKMKLTFTTTSYFGRDPMIIKIDGDCQATNNCCPTFSGIHEHLRNGFTETMTTTPGVEVVYAEVENLGEITTNHLDEL